MTKVSERILRPDEKMFWAAEPFKVDKRKGTYHCHALLQTRWSAKQVEDWYKQHYGRAEVLRYNPKQGAAGYVAKYLTKGAHDYDMILGTIEHFEKKYWQ